MANEILGRIKAHREKMTADCRLDVPEWGDGKKPLKVTWTPVTVAERRRMFEEDAEGNQPHGGLVMVRAIIRKACDEKGQRLFDEMAEHDLLHDAVADVVGKIGNAILYGVGVTPPKSAQDAVDQEKNA